MDYRWSLKKRTKPPSPDHYHYRRATVCSGFISTILLVSFFLCGNTGDLIFPQLSRSIVACLSLLGNLLASSTYVARAADLANDKSNKRLARIWEGIATGIGILIGIAVGITVLIVKHTVAKTFIGITNAVIFIMRAVAAFAGLSNRLFSLDRRRDLEWYALVAATIIGLVLGTVFFCVGSIPTISVVGVALFFNGAGLPTLIAFPIAVGYITSAYESCADYTAKTCLFLKIFLFEKTLDQADGDSQHVRDRFLEYGCSFLLSAIGLLFGIGLIVSGAASLAAAVMVIPVCVSIFGGIGSRVGRCLDGLYQCEIIESKKPPITIEDSTTSNLLNKLVDSSSDLVPAPAPAPASTPTSVQTRAPFFPPQNRQNSLSVVNSTIQPNELVLPCLTSLSLTMNPE